MSEFDLKAKDWDTPSKIERARSIADAIRSKVSLSKEMSAFEYGCGTGLLSFELKDELGPITLADSSEGMLEVLRDKIQSGSVTNMKPVRLDLSKDPLPDDRFDIIYTMMTLHHIPDTRQILEQFHTILNPGGYLCIADLDKEDGSFHGHHVHDVHHGFDRDALAKKAKEAGFTDVVFSTAYKLTKEVEDDSHTFPIFLMVAKKD
jgi:ubiquinone/menaquinone biosynthesis C-methylase UbiE